MNKIVKVLTVAALAMSANVFAHTEHTYLQVRPQGINLPLEYTTFNERMTAKLEDRFGGNFMVTGWYAQSSNDNKIGEYFGIHGKSEFILNYDDLTDETKCDFDLKRIINLAETGDKATVKFHPKEETWGVRFDYYQNLDKLVKGLYLKVNLPIVGVKRHMDMDIDSTDALVKSNLYSYFKGEYTEDASGTVPGQFALDHAYINHHDGSETGVADIEVTLGYKFLNKEKYHLGLNLAIIIPTGNDGEGKHLFEAIYGAGKHFGFGGGLDAQARIWGDCDHNIKLNLVANYRYLFESSEHRLYRIKDYHFAYLNLGRVTDSKLTPAPNALTLNSDVTPGSMFDGILAFAYNNGGFCFDLGYNMYFREDEDVHVKGDLPTGDGHAWYIAKRDISFGTGHTTFVASTDAQSTTALTKDSLDSESASTPSQFTNSVYAGLGYAFKEWDYPLMLGIGGKYEFAAKNSAIEQWQLWGKASLSF